MIKRTLDIILATALLPIAIPLILVGMLLMAMEMRTNPLFVQVRVGRYRKPFRIFKLRTMVPGTSNAASHEVGSAHITKMGGWMRMTKIDELPQLANVLNGTMSFVGPRPCLPSQQELILRRTEHGVYQLRPGITGPAQIQGVDMSTPERLAMIDATYLDEWSLSRDIGILADTVRGRGSGDAASVIRRNP